MKIKILFLISFFVIACNFGTNNDDLRISFFEKEGNIKFPKKVNVLKYDENIETGTYSIQAIINKSEVENFIEKNEEFRIYDKEIIGDGINFSQDDLEITDIELYLGLEKMTIPRGSHTYIFRRIKNKGKIIYLLNTESGMFYGYIEM